MQNKDEIGATSDAPIYKIATSAQWAVAVSNGVYDGSPDDMRDGFIHFSTRAQLRETARRHFMGKADLVLIEISPASLGSALKWEPSRRGDLFPHLYAPLPVAAACWVRNLPLDEDGCPDVDTALAGSEG